MIHSGLMDTFKIAILVLILVAGVTSKSEGDPRPFEVNQGAAYGPETTKMPPEDDSTKGGAVGGSARGGALQLAKNGIAEEDQQQLQELLAILDEETKVATKTKMNNDYVPGMVTVLHAEQLEALGVQTVAEALATVPGIQVARLPTGEPTIKVRGFAFPFNAGNIKVMLNSIALSRESSGINSSVLLIPLAQIDRIEVIRGPGSSLYGDFAMAGVVNIITKDTGGRLFGLAGDDASRGGGGHYTYRDDAHAFDVGVNISAMDDGNNAMALNRDPDEQRTTGVFHLNYRHFSFTAEGVGRRVDFEAQPPPGAPEFPPGTDPSSLRKEESWAMEGRQTIELGSKASLDAYLSYLQNNFDADEPFTEFRGDRVETGCDLNWSPWVGHQMLLGAFYTDSDIDKAAQAGPSGTADVSVSDISRRNYALNLQDQMALSERFSLTLGIRYDDYNDVGSRWTPRVAAVYRLGEHHVIKAQYSEGFRTPTFWELYRTGNADKDLDFEVMDTTELSYLYRRPNAVGRVTLYYSEIDNGIYHASGGGFDNIVDIYSKGVEVEWEQRLGETFRWQANLSYNDTWDGRSTANGHESPGIAAWLGNLACFVQPAAKLLVTGRLLHVGNRYPSDGPLEGYDTVDLTVSRMDLWRDGVTLRVGVKNIFDDTRVYLTQLPDSLTEDEYRGRTWWLQIAYDF
jgi:outer membrane receptor for ferrienterochelin and colicins